MFTNITIIAVVLIIAYFLSWYFRHKSREKERLMLIEQGVDPEELPDNSDDFDFSFNLFGTLINFVIIIQLFYQKI